MYLVLANMYISYYIDFKQDIWIRKDFKLLFIESAFLKFCYKYTLLYHFTCIYIYLKSKYFAVEN